MDLIVHINGWPGIGKLTIARILAKRLSGKLLDNHTLLNPAEALFDRSDPLHGSLRQAVRVSVLDHAAQLQPGVPLVLTDALSDDPTDQALFDDYRSLAARRRARLVSVMLECEPDENVRRLTSAGRSELYKLTRPEFLKHLRSTYRLLRPQGVDLIDVDVSALSAEEAAVLIERALPASRQ
jgi:thymidylate kinase